MKNPKVGERAFIKGYPKLKGAITLVNSKNEAILHLDEGSRWIGEYHKLMRLKPKKKPREIWVNEYSDGLNSILQPSKEYADSSAGPSRIRCVRFVEVPEKALIDFKLTDVSMSYLKAKSFKLPK